MEHAGKGTRPVTIGEAMADEPGLISDGHGGAMWIEPRPWDQCQPRLVAGATCLLVTFFENWWVLSAPIRLWK
jgi:hypothetical protein